MVSAPLVAASVSAQAAFAKPPPQGVHEHTPSAQSGATSLAMSSETASFVSGAGAGQDHILVPFNVLRPAKCMACGKNMWGASEARCTACGGVVHLKCKEMLPPHSCEPRKAVVARKDAALGGSMFGSELTDQCELEGRFVPLVVEKCIEAVEMNGTLISPDHARGLGLTIW